MDSKLKFTCHNGNLIRRNDTFDNHRYTTNSTGQFVRFCCLGCTHNSECAYNQQLLCVCHKN